MLSSTNITPVQSNMYELISTMLATARINSKHSFHFIMFLAIACSHQRCADYFMESIRTHVGFYGRECKSYLHYIFGMCQKELSNTLAGAHCETSTRGLYFVRTNSKYPYARGQYEGMRSSRVIGNQLEVVMKNLDKICSGLDDADSEDLFFYEFLNCKKFEKKVLPWNSSRSESTSEDKTSKEFPLAANLHNLFFCNLTQCPSSFQCKNIKSFAFRANKTFSFTLKQKEREIWSEGIIKNINK